MKTLIIGNTGSGKSAMAEQLIGIKHIAHLSLDEIAWSDAGEALPLADSLKQLYAFVERNDQWVIEGCHCDLVEAAIAYCTELRFLTPGCEDCVNRCLSKPRRQVADSEGKKTVLDQIISWVGKYDYRVDGHGQQRHRDLFDSFIGPKKEYAVVV